MTLEVSLAMAEREGRWLLQLRDDIDTIVHPGTWGLFGGHLDPGEGPEPALRRELQEEIGWEARDLRFWFEHRQGDLVVHFFRTSLSVPLDELVLGEGQDMALASLAELVSGRVWSPRLQETRPLAPTLQRAVMRLVQEQEGP
jgi:8-oxo-dGTP diphosphatase